MEIGEIKEERKGGLSDSSGQSWRVMMTTEALEANEHGTQLNKFISMPSGKWIGEERNEDSTRSNHTVAGRKSSRLV